MTTQTATNTSLITTSITAYNYALTLLARIIKKAEKLGLTPPSVKVVESFQKMYRKSPSTGIWHEITKEMAYAMDSFAVATLTIVDMVRVEIIGEAPVLAGWQFVAAIERVATDNGPGVMLRIVPSHKDVLPLEYRNPNKADKCDHCNAIRRRNTTYILQHVDGTYKRVGSTCLTDHLGGLSPHYAIAYAEAVIAAREAMENDDNFGGYGGGRSEQGVLTPQYFAQVSAEIREHGWVSKKQVFESGVGYATANRTWEVFFPSLNPVEKSRPATVTDLDIQTATAAIEWATEVDDSTSDYLHNCKVVASMGAITKKFAGIAASIIPAFRKEMEKKAQKEAQAKELATHSNEYVGEIGKRYTWDLTFVFMTSFESDFGTSYICRFKDASGNTFVWFASNPPDMDPDVTFSVTGTVKKHQTYGNIKQTVITRCTVKQQG